MVKGWLTDYTYYGHMQEDGAYMLSYDEGCCHIQGEACEWVVCQDNMLSVLAGGKSGAHTVGYYGASPLHTTVPSHLANSSTTVLVFQAHNTAELALTIGSPLDTTLSLVMTANAVITLSAGFMTVAAGQVMELSMYNATASYSYHLDPVACTIPIALELEMQCAHALCLCLVVCLVEPTKPHMARAHTRTHDPKPLVGRGGVEIGLSSAFLVNLFSVDNVTTL